MGNGTAGCSGVWCGWQTVVRNLAHCTGESKSHSAPLLLPVAGSGRLQPLLASHALRHTRLYVRVNCALTPLLNIANPVSHLSLQKLGSIQAPSDVVVTL